jgi:transcriptional antiterminator
LSIACRLTIYITLHIINAQFKAQSELKQMERVKAYFANNPTCLRVDSLREATKFEG